MPVLNIGFQSKTPAGDVIPSNVSLRHFGPRVPVVVGVPKAAAEALAAEGEEVPRPIAGFGLIDTGATMTSIDQDVAKRLNLQPTGTVKLGTASGPRTASQYAFSAIVMNQLTLFCPLGAGCDLAGQGIIVLLGMDLLSECVLIVNGPAGLVTLTG